ncbi:hypothetical protein CC1G_15174 [Coprinopsis cinerea okayama7|uniref:Uncharacterized protein n=1 Tax=Coprinopsis cinerea (strain Okayama-7 / 130 / ATCC MYA-4618 / FGSC 9003) TaxID=240176 RepID=D6RPI3_COPC7|nr:hypothetical protein CC1G_15174 [Coprinopsis cinerea okayama7\|eukprot:XP_002910535.1 hypothetical protein CC1G_15174 [Coprinopsis cinerea okayama7\
MARPSTIKLECIGGATATQSGRNDSSPIFEANPSFLRPASIHPPLRWMYRPCLATSIPEFYAQGDNGEVDLARRVVLGFIESDGEL